MERLCRKYQTAKQYVPQPLTYTMDGAKIGIIAVGSTDQAIQEARHLMAKEGIATDYMRVRAVPFTEEVEQFVRDHDRIYVVEINRDSQLRQLLLLNMPADQATKLRSAACMDGMPLSARWVKDEILSQEEK